MIELIKLEEVTIGSMWRSKLGVSEVYEITSKTDDMIAVTRYEKSELAIKTDCLIEALKLPFDFVNTVLEEELDKAYGNDWRFTRKGILWFTNEEFIFNFNKVKRF